jgi:bisphosphoglycerate-dependent phosphoglycerate mutase
LAEALKYEREYLSKVKRADKICFVLTDGAPNFTSAAIDEYNKLRKNALVYGVAIGDDLPCLTDIFGKDRIIDARDLKSLPQQLGKIIRCNLIKQ